MNPHKYILIAIFFCALRGEDAIQNTQSQDSKIAKSTTYTHTKVLLDKSKGFSKESVRERLSQMTSPFHKHNQDKPHIHEHSSRVQAILNGKVLIDDKWLLPNDSINGFKIVRVSPNSVTIERAKIKHTIGLNESVPHSKKGRF